MLSGQSQITRQASVCQLAEKQKKKANRSKRCKSLLLLSSPFTGSSYSVKSSLLALWHPNSNNNNNQQSNQFEPGERPDDLDCSGDSLPVGSPDSSLINKSTSSSQQTPSSLSSAAAAKCVKMKLFEQQLDKLFSPKAMKQLNQAINSLDTAINGCDSTHQQQQQHFLGKRKRTCPSSAASLRKFIATKLLDSAPNSNLKNANNNNIIIKQINLTKSERNKLLLACLPQPIRNLLNELYLRGPSTVGIFRKSPNAKHCKELRHKLETDSQSSIEQFQVTVIASVFKEWLRSLPDCLLMSRLYPQWIDVAKLIEPLYQHQQQQQQLHSLDDSACSDTSTMGSNSIANASLRPSLDGSVASSLTDKATEETADSQTTATGQRQEHQQQLPLDRARSCSTMMAITGTKDFHSINRATGCDSSLLADRSSALDQHQPISMSAFALSERHSECLRIVCQLLEALNEANLILLRSFICVLWHIANNSQLNKMSANNLGVCVGQSLLNDEHQSLSSSLYNGKSGSAYGSGSTFTKRHRRSRSQCLLSSTLSLTNATLLQSGCYLDTSGAQETAKYVPMLVAFMIENAPTLFGQDVGELFQQEGGPQPTFTANSISPIDTSQRLQSAYKNENEMVTTTSSSDTGDSITIDKEILQSPNSFDHVDSGANSLLDDNTPIERDVKLLRQQILVEGRHKSPADEQHRKCSAGNNLSAIISINHQHAARIKNTDDDNDSRTTSILIVNNNNNPPKSHKTAGGSPTEPEACHKNRLDTIESQQQQHHHRPLSATESTSSSSRASSSTSGVHSESPAFSNEMDSHNARTTTTCSNSPAPSSVSSPSSVSNSASVSPVQERQVQPQQHPVFYTTTNLNSLHQQQQDWYLLYHRASLNPQRSHVMSLRNYYLSLQQDQKQQHHQRQPQRQQWQPQQRQPQQRQPQQRQPQNHNHSSYRNSIHSLQTSDQMLPHQQQQALINNKLNQSSHEQHPPRGFVAQQQRQLFILANQQQQLRQLQAQTQQATTGSLMTHHQAIQRPQPRLAKIRQNQFNGIYVKNTAPLMANHHSLINLAQPQPQNQSQVKTKLKPVSSTSSDDHSSDDSDDWAESTMV